MAALQSQLAAAKEEARRARAEAAVTVAAAVESGHSHSLAPASGTLPAVLSPADMAAIQEAMHVVTLQAADTWRAAALAVARARTGDDGGRTAQEVALVERLSDMSAAASKAQAALHDALFAAETAKQQLALRRDAEVKLMEREAGLTQRLAAVTVERDVLAAKVKDLQSDALAVGHQHTVEKTALLDQVTKLQSQALQLQQQLQTDGMQRLQQAQAEAAAAAQAEATARSQAAETARQARELEALRAEELARAAAERRQLQEEEAAQAAAIQARAAAAAVASSMAYDGDGDSYPTTDAGGLPYVRVTTSAHGGVSREPLASPRASSPSPEFLASPLKPRKSPMSRPMTPSGGLSFIPAAPLPPSASMPSPAAGMRARNAPPGRDGRSTAGSGSGGSTPAQSSAPTPLNTPDASRAPSPMLMMGAASFQSAAAAQAAAQAAASLEATTNAAADRLASKLAAWENARDKVRVSRSVSRERGGGRSRSSSRDSRDSRSSLGLTSPQNDMYLSQPSRGAPHISGGRLMD